LRARTHKRPLGWAFLGMGNSRREIAAVLDNQGGVIARRQHPDLATAIAWLHRRGELVSVLPGVYAEPSVGGERAVRLRAAMLWAPEAVLTGRVAASVSFWPGIRYDRITLASCRHRTAPHGFSASRRSIPADLIAERQGVRFTSPALTALDLCDEVGGDQLVRFHPAEHLVDLLVAGRPEVAD